jgi:hypothetical protein
MRGTEQARLDAAAMELIALVRELDAEPIEGEPTT